jgi:hypothetical protein
MAGRQDDITPDERLRRAEEEKRDAAAHWSTVDSLFGRLKRHLDENHFVDRIYEQIDASRRNT